MPYQCVAHLAVEQDTVLQPPVISQIPLALPPNLSWQPNYRHQMSMDPSTEPIYVNPKQYHRILIRREKRAREALRRKVRSDTNIRCVD